MTELFRRCRGFIKDCSAAAMLEFAIAVPIMLILAMGVADFARVYMTDITLANASRNGAEYGVANSLNATAVVPDSMIKGTKLEAGRDSIGMAISAGVFCRCPDGTTVSCSTGNCGAYGGPQTFDSVAVSKVVRFILRYPGLPDTILVQRKSILRGH